MSKKTFLLGTAAVLVLACTPASASHFNGWYVSIEGGANWIGDIDNTLFTTLFSDPLDTDPFFSTRRTTADQDTGWAILGAVGYGFGGGWRGEFEVGYRDNDGNGNFDFLTNVDPGPVVNPLLVPPFPGLFYATVPHSIEVSEVSLMANVLYDFSFGERFSLSLGAGVGADQLDYDVSVGPFFDGGTGFSRGDTTWKFAWQLMAGLNYRVASQTEVYLNYRYLQVERDSGDDFGVFRDFEGGPFDGYFLDAHLVGDDSIDKQSVTIGLRFDLAPDYVAPPPPPPAPPPPPPAPMPKEFIVFFGFDKSNLTAEAMAVVQQAAAAYKETGSANVRVVGHTDRAGSDEYNHALSLRRANSVKAGLVGEGVSDGSISIDGRGESEPMVATDDGVREPQNRRVNISI